MTKKNYLNKLFLITNLLMKKLKSKLFIKIQILIKKYIKYNQRNIKFILICKFYLIFNNIIQIFIDLLI